MNGFSREIPQTAVDRFAQVSSTTSNWISNDAKSSLRMMKKDYGNITKFPALLGRPEMVMTFDVEDAEKVFRFDGQYPFRRAIETLTHYRQKLRPDIYGEYGSLLSEWVFWLHDLELESIQIFSYLCADKTSDGTRWDLWWIQWWWNLRLSSSTFRKWMKFLEISSTCEPTSINHWHRANFRL